MTPIAIDQTGVEIYTADGIFLKQYVIPQAGTVLPQHSHIWGHLTMVAVGAIEVWSEEEYLGVKRAPCGIEIAAGIKHRFLTLEPNTVLFCLHNLHAADKVAILAEHALEF